MFAYFARQRLDFRTEADVMAASGLSGVWTEPSTSDADGSLDGWLGSSGIESMDGLDIGWVGAFDMVAEPIMVERGSLLGKFGSGG